MAGMIHGPASVFAVTTAFPIANCPLAGASAIAQGWTLVEHVTVTFPAAFTTADPRPTFCSWLTSTARSNVSSFEHVTEPAATTHPVVGSTARLALLVTVTVVKSLNSYAPRSQVASRGT